MFFEKCFNPSQSLRFLVLRHERVLCGSEVLWRWLIVSPNLGIFPQCICMKIRELLSEVLNHSPLARPPLRPPPNMFKFFEHLCLYTEAAPPRVLLWVCGSPCFTGVPNKVLLLSASGTFRKAI